MGGNYQEKCFLGWDHLMHCNKKLVRNGQMFFSCTLKKQQQINKPMSIWDTLYLQKQTILTILQHDIILWMMKNSFYYIDSVSYIYIQDVQDGFGDIFWNSLTNSLFRHPVWYRILDGWLLFFDTKTERMWVCYYSLLFHKYNLQFFFAKMITAF